MERNAPATMATQHPDNVSAPAWLPQGGGFIDTKHEVEECFRAFAQLRCQEYMWDWEGKHVDEAVVEKLFEKHHAFFKRNELGRDVFLTYRVPNVWVERGYRIARAFASIISANDFARGAGLHAPPIFECILPLTTQGRQPFVLRKQYAAIVKAFGGDDIAKAFSLNAAGPHDVQVIPLVEYPENLVGLDSILGDYVRECRKARMACENVRAFIARSDPALNNGLAPATIAGKAALAKCAEFEDRTGVKTQPIIGVGCLPFRGGLSPESVKWFAKNHAGTHTFTIQSAFRYDYADEKVKAAINFLNKMPKKPSSDDYDYQKVKQLIAVFTKHYRKTVERLAGEVNKIAVFLPPRRERKLHIGLFGYARSVRGKSLPRAIGFTGALYSLGVPPEFIGTGRGIKEAREKNLGKQLDDFMPLLKHYLKTAGGCLNQENLSALAGAKNAWNEVRLDVELVEEEVGEKLGPSEEEHALHHNLSSNILMMVKHGQNPSNEIVQAAAARRSLG